MSQNQFIPKIYINPQYATNNTDPQIAGFYQIQPNSSNLATRITYSNIGLQGEIRLNTSTLPHTFQGYNGNVWVDFNATQGPQGAPGKDFTNQVNFINSNTAGDASSEVALGRVFATTYANVASNISNVYIRSIAGGNYTVNSNLVIQSNIITQNSNVITVTAQPVPYRWDISSPYNTPTYLRNLPTGISYAWGETSNWTSHSAANITRGQAVRLTSESNNLVITPITYTSLTGISPFIEPFNMLGIAMQNSGDGSSCLVCTKGITEVLCTSNITGDFVTSSSVSTVGIDGLVGRDGGIFCNTVPAPTVSYIKAGYFLQSGVGIAANGNYALFYVNPHFQIV